MPELRINIDPCHEDWNKMNPVEKGRFCAACQKKVIDLTEAKPEAIIKTIQETNGHFCGRFSSTVPESRSTSVSAPSIVRYNLVKVFLLAIIMHFCLITAKAQTLQNDTASSKPEKDEKKPLKRASMDCIIDGTVREEGTSDLVVGAIISVIQNGSIVGSCISDTAGHFELKLSKGTYFEGSFDLSTRYIGYERQLMKDIPTGKKEYLISMFLKPNREEFTVVVTSTQPITMGLIVGTFSNRIDMYGEEPLIIQTGTETIITKTGVKRIPW